MKQINVQLYQPPQLLKLNKDLSRSFNSDPRKHERDILEQPHHLRKILP